MDIHARQTYLIQLLPINAFTRFFVKCKALKLNCFVTLIRNFNAEIPKPAAID